MLTSSSIVKFFQTAKKSVSLLFIKRSVTVICSQVDYLPPKLFWRSHLFANKYQNIYIFNNIKSPLCLNPFSTITSKDIHNLADSIFEEYPVWVKSFKKEELIKILEFFASYGCSSVELKKNCLKYLSPKNSSYIKAKHIAELDSDVISLMPFMALSLVSLRKAAKQARDDKNEIVGFPNRISYLSHHLEAPINELIPVLMKHPSLLTMKFKKLHHKMIVLKNAGILSKDLLKDLWIFNYNEEMLINRITAAETAGAKLKPWMLRCSERIFTSMLTKYSQTQNILGGNDVVKYLSEKLNCSPKYVEFMMERNKALKSINIPKVDEILNFLYENGYTSQEIRLFPRVFCTKVHTLKRRMEEYKQIRSTLPSIPQLCVSSNNSWRKTSRQTST